MGKPPRPAPDEPLSAAAGLRARTNRPGGRPDQTERPHPRRRGHPINHLVAGAATCAPRTQVRLAAPSLPVPGRRGWSPRPERQAPPVNTPHQLHALPAAHRASSALRAAAEHGNYQGQGAHSATPKPRPPAPNKPPLNHLHSRPIQVRRLRACSAQQCPSLIVMDTVGVGPDAVGRLVGRARVVPPCNVCFPGILLRHLCW